MKQLFIGFALLLSAMSFAQTTITGTVTTTASGETVPFVNVILNNSTTATTTDDNGRYSIDINSELDVLKFSALGFISQSITVGTRP